MPTFFNNINRNLGNQGSRFLSPTSDFLNIVKEIVVVSSLLIYLFSIHWSLGSISLLAALPILIVQSKLGNEKYWLLFHQTPIAREIQYIAFLLRERQFAKEIRLFHLGEYLLKQWSTKYTENMNNLMKLIRKQQSANVGLDVLTAIFYAISAGVIIWVIRIYNLTIGDFVAISQAIQGTQASTNRVSLHVAKIYENTLFIQDFFQFMEFEDKNLKEYKGKNRFPEPLRYGITLENLTFSYLGGNKEILKGISLHINPGEKIAIVGENGSGKTTLVKCLMGLYPLSNGQIYYDDLKIEDISSQEMYKKITVIFQDFMKYSFSVSDNIGFGDIDRIENIDEIKNIAVKTGVDNFVRNFEQGYETYLGRAFKEGEDLSGGQWQKIALARALFRDGEVIILDEPTAALDPQSELEVFRQFDLLTKNKTTLFISHRMAAARMADRIVVLKEGQVVEIGTHDELITLGQEYYRMYEMQSQWYKSDTPVSAS